MFGLRACQSYILLYAGDSSSHCIDTLQRVRQTRENEVGIAESWSAISVTVGTKVAEAMRLQYFCFTTPVSFNNTLTHNVLSLAACCSSP